MTVPMPLLSMKQLATELGVSEITVRRAYRSGEIPGERIGRAVRFDLAHVRQAMRERALSSQQKVTPMRVRGAVKAMRQQASNEQQPAPVKAVRIGDRRLRRTRKPR